jgi:hypothetical protein
LPSQPKLLGHIHAAAWGLLSIAECGVEEKDTLLLHVFASITAGTEAGRT